MDAEITVAICNFNTTELTNNCIRSVLKHVSDAIDIVVLDNSDSQKFQLASDIKKPVRVIDNTSAVFIDFEKFLANNQCKTIAANKNGSLKHAMSIQFLLSICLTQKMLLLDSDAEIIKDIDFLDDESMTVADVEEEGKISERSVFPDKIYRARSRFLPMIQLFNVDRIRQLGLSYFDVNRMHGGFKGLSEKYDTGASFYEDVVQSGNSFKRIIYTDYIKHLNHGSWKHSQS